MRTFATLCISVLFFVTGSPSQEPLADGVTSFLGGGSQVAWFEKGGTVWVTDGTLQGTRDTGVPAGSYSVATDRLIVYRQNRIDRINADGSTTALVPPFAFDGFNVDASEPTIWRLEVHAYNAEFIRVSRWTSLGWATSVAGVYASGVNNSFVAGVYPRSGRYLALRSSPNGDDVWDILADPPHQEFLSRGGSSPQGPALVSGGIVFRGGLEDGNRPVIMPVLDHGQFFSVVAPWTWGTTGLPHVSIREPITGFPFADWDVGPELLAFLCSDVRGFSKPPGTLVGLLWSGLSQQILALVEQGGARSLQWLDRATDTWHPTIGVGAPDSIDFVGDFGGITHLVLSDSNGASLVRYDAASHTATTLASGLVSIARGLKTFASGFVFAASDAEHGTELWISDDTPSGTRLVADLRAGLASSRPRDFVRLGARLLFSGDSANGLQLWSLDRLQVEWRRNPQTGRFYRLTAATSWADAQTEAHNLGGELATVRDPGEQGWLVDTFGATNLWIGLSDFDHDGNFTWSSGEPLGFTNWCPGQPDRLAGEAAVHIANYPGYCVGGWNDQDPNDAYPGIVERSGPPRPVEEFGAGCSPGVPEPVATAQWTGGWPQPGGTVDFQFVLGLGYLPTGVLFLSADASAFGGSPLPLDLTSLGAPGCYLHVRPDDVVAQWGGYWGSWGWTLPASIRIPSDPALSGAVVFVQALAFDLCNGGCLRDLRTTNGLRITIGS